MVRVQWSFDYSGIRPPTLRPALNFAVEVTALGRDSEVETVPGDHLYLLFTEVVKLVEYQFRVTARSGDTASQPSQPSDTLLGGQPSCTLPTNLRVTAVQAFSVSLAWDQSTCEEYVLDPLYFIKRGNSSEEVASAQVSSPSRHHGSRVPMREPCCFQTTCLPASPQQSLSLPPSLPPSFPAVPAVFSVF